MKSIENKISKTQLEFIKWVYRNHIDDIADKDRSIVIDAAEETDDDRDEGYLSGSVWAQVLNRVRDKYLQEYAKYKRFYEWPK